jgi:transposase
VEYLGTAETLLGRLRGDDGEVKIKSYSHGDVAALLHVAEQLGIVEILNRHIPTKKNGEPAQHDNLSVGASILLAALGRACHPTSKRGWYDWCKDTSLEYLLRRSFAGLDSQHFWDQMDTIPVEAISKIEEEILQALMKQYDVKLDTLLLDATNFFTFIASDNERCTIAKRGKNKQRRIDLRQVGLFLLVTRAEQFPLFHRTYQGNTNDAKLFSESFADIISRLQAVTKQLADITLVFDKGNNSKKNFALLDTKEELHYVASLVPSYFKELVTQANANLAVVKFRNEEIPAFRKTYAVWGKDRTCIVLLSEQLREGQIRGINQTLEKVVPALEKFRSQLERPRHKNKRSKEDIEKHLEMIIDCPFIKEIIRYEIAESQGMLTFRHFIDNKAFEKLISDVLGRRILVTNRHQWSTEEIIAAYRAQSKVEYSFRNVKNPDHLAIRPQYHWTDQKSHVHVVLCVLGYLLTTCAYSTARKKAGYRKNTNSFLDDLKRIRLAVIARITSKKSTKTAISYQLEQLSPDLQCLAELFGLTDCSRRPNIKLSV